MISFKEYISESSLGFKKYMRKANPKQSTNKFAKRAKRLKSMEQRNQMRAAQAGHTAYTSITPKVIDKQTRKAGALTKQGETMKATLGGMRFIARDLQPYDVKRATSVGSPVSTSHVSGKKSSGFAKFIKRTEKKNKP